MTTVFISISCADRVGLVSDITGHLFDLGLNLGDTTFAVLGGGAEFSTICELTEDTTLDSVRTELTTMAVLRDAEITVMPFDLDFVHAPSARITHRISVTGGDRPGLIARLSEVFVQFKANIVRLNSQIIPEADDYHYSINISVSIPEETEQSCLATVFNTAGEMGLRCSWRAVNG